MNSGVVTLRRPKKAGTDIELLLENASYFVNAKLDYDGGPRSPHLARIEKSPDILGAVIAPRVQASP